MDDSVIRAMVQWPNVPDCYGWLRLNRRGDWLLRGERVTHPKLQDFIARNYLRNDGGSYYFQNGPQRVHLELDYCPYVLHVENPESPADSLISQTQQRWQNPDTLWLDDRGQFLLTREFEGEQQCGLVDDRDAPHLLPLLRSQTGEALSEEQLAQELDALAEQPHERLSLLWGKQLLPVRSIAHDRVADTFGFNPKPQKS